jgi:type I restriction enzyme S subunit
MERFDQSARPVFQRVVACERETSVLSALRDTLLPKLISGEIRVRNAEKVIGATV